MKSILCKLFVLACFALFFINASAQVVQGQKVTIDYTADDLGNATIEYSLTLPAAQWDYFKRNIAGNVSLLKRIMERAMPKYFLSDFNYTEDGMNRSYKLKFKAQGVSNMNSSGLWVADLDTKNPDITKLTDRDFVLNEDILSNGSLVQTTMKLHLPPSASNAKVEKDSFGKAVLTYSTGSGMGTKALTILGVLLVLGGIVLYFRNAQSNKGKLVLAHIKTKEQETQAVG